MQDLSLICGGARTGGGGRRWLHGCANFGGIACFPRLAGGDMSTVLERLAKHLCRHPSPPVVAPQPAAPTMAAQPSDDPAGTVILSNGVTMPAVGFGTGIGQADVEKHGGSSQAEVTIAACDAALDCGYRAIDTAQRYGTEPAVGQVLKRRFETGSLSRADVFITTKVANPRPAPAGMLPGGGLKYMLQPQLSAYEGVLDEFAGCLRNLQLEHVDLLLIHFPGPPAPDGSSLSPELSQRKRLEAWNALETIYREGKAKAIGVSNYCIRHLQELLTSPSVEFLPHVNQCELHTRLQQPALRKFCASHNIALTAYSPLSGADLGAAPVVAAASKYNVSPAAVVLSWLRQHGCIVIPKSLTPSRIAENFQSAGGEGNGMVRLTREEMALIDTLDEGRRINADTEAIV